MQLCFPSCFFLWSCHKYGNLHQSSLIEKFTEGTYKTLPLVSGIWPIRIISWGMWPPKWIRENWWPWLDLMDQGRSCLVQWLELGNLQQLRSGFLESLGFLMCRKYIEIMSIIVREYIFNMRFIWTFYCWFLGFQQFSSWWLWYDYHINNVIACCSGTVFRFDCRGLISTWPQSNIERCETL